MAKIKRKCRVCGKIFEKSPSVVKSGRGKYCSRECLHAKTPEQRFWDFVDKNGPKHPTLKTKCWLWSGYIFNGISYGRIWSKGRYIKAHRFSWELHNGQIPNEDGDDRLLILHRCDNPLCVRPSHLHLGTQAQNVQEMWARKRRRGDGEHNPMSKLTWDQVKEIRRLYESEKGKRRNKQYSLVKLGEMFGVHSRTIQHIVKNRTWNEKDDYVLA